VIATPVLAIFVLTSGARADLWTTQVMQSVGTAISGGGSTLNNVNQMNGSGFTFGQVYENTTNSNANAAHHNMLRVGNETGRGRENVPPAPARSAHP
jgi:hypothetical protein